MARQPLKLLALKPVVALISAGLLLSGCASMRGGNYESSEVLQLSPVNDGYQSLSYKYLPAGKRVRLAIDRHDQSMVFEGGKSFLEALVLPEVAIPYLLEIQSEIVVAGDENHARIFYPVLTFLDAAKQPIQTFSDLPAKFRTPLIRKANIRTAITVDQSLANARYLVVHTDASQLDYSISTKSPSKLLKAGNFSTMIYAPVSEPRYRVNFGPEGWIKLQIKRKAG